MIFEDIIRDDSNNTIIEKSYTKSNVIEDESCNLHDSGIYNEDINYNSISEDLKTKFKTSNKITTSELVVQGKIRDKYSDGKNDGKVYCDNSNKDESVNIISSEETGNNDSINIVIKSCKNITSKQALLIIPITKFFSNKETLNKLIVILKGESISLRLIDWFVTNYCKKNNVMYNMNDFKKNTTNQTEEQLQSFDNYIIVHNNYKGQLKAYSKRNFDPFCRRNRIRFYYDDGKYFITTVGQLNFFKWALETHIVDYIEKYLKAIEDDMNLRCETVKKTGTKINPSTNNTVPEETTKKNKIIDGTIPVETLIKTKRIGATRKKRKEISTAASKSLSIHNFPTTLIFD
jgi:hypothetical protein